MKLPVTLFTLLASIPKLFAQRPTHIPGNNEPVNFFESPASILMYIIIPAIVVVLYVIWRRKIKKEREAHNKNPKKNTGDQLQ